MQIPDWVQDAVFYQIFPDRFARSERLAENGLKFEAWDTAPTHYGFKGGDLYGVAEKLDYLRELGITALYLNPIFSSASNHRYHPYDFYEVDPLLGGNDALRHLLDEAHRRGMRRQPVPRLDGKLDRLRTAHGLEHHDLGAGEHPQPDRVLCLPRQGLHFPLRLLDDVELAVEAGGELYGENSCAVALG